MFGDMASVDDDIQLVRDLIAWAGSNAAQVARAINKPNTTVNRFANGTAKHRMARDTLQALKEAYPTFPGFAEVPPANAAPFKFEGPSAVRMRDDLPIIGTALGAARVIDGDAIEQVFLNRADVVQYVRRPVILNDNAGAYGLFVSGSSMEPRHMDGETIIVDPKGRVRSGEDVVVYLRPPGDRDDGESARAVLVKRLVRRTATYIELEQYSPALTFRIEADDVLRIDRVLPWSELLS